MRYLVAKVVALHDAIKSDVDLHVFAQPRNTDGAVGAFIFVFADVADVTVHSINVSTDVGRRRCRTRIGFRRRSG